MSAASEPKILLVIPLYNHGATIAQVVEEARAYTDSILVIDDGSSDEGVRNLPADIACVRHASNQGKGAAIRTAEREALSRGYTHILTMDADGQHKAHDIPAFLKAIHETPHAIIIGARRFSGKHVPFASRFGRAFSGFWMRVQTGCGISDMQSGFRAYPLDVLGAITSSETGYAFEVEVIVKAAWAGFAIRELPISVYYPPPDKRVSHFDKFRDNLKLSLLNTRLTIRALIPLPFQRHALDVEGKLSLLRPLEALRLLMADKGTPLLLACSAGVGMAVSTLPVPGLQSLLLLLFIGWLSLHRLAALLVIPLTWPPFVPGLGVLVGYRLRHGVWLEEFSLRTLGYEAGQRLLDWIIGSLVLAPLLGCCLAVIVFIMARLVQRGWGLGTARSSS